ncbi:probable ATP-dependent DNA helicase HFM1 [Patella vulgata]|uniref:probable ATP-dependent DNA helicase HFM1 n=1 Tax=Patella vulgata TaxID=6465 RepID=UPI0024A9ED29|nr:probable ATP-dependent DNA helicase HFM1 [Patella vulgata]
MVVSAPTDQLSHGIGVHHAGMDSQDRHSIEDLFRQGILPILVATSTLAMGVNLPAHLVILKSTTFYSMGCPTEYPDTQILQMIGRAGRPQFDTTATAVIMTKTSSKAKYESIVNGTQTIESSLHKNLIEHLNAEVVLHTITDIALAVEWIRHTFLYVRIMKNPRHYGVPPGVDKKQVEKRLEDLCLKSVNSLAGMSLVKMNDETLEIESTETGKLMARYCIAFETMKKFHNITGKEHIDELLTLITDCAEFQDITLRQTEKTTLNTLNKDKIKESIRYPLIGKIKTKQMKINCLIQASFSCLPIHDYSLTNDVTKIFRVGVRVVKCLLEFLWQRKDYKVLLSAIQLSKCFKQRLWEDSKYVTKQLDKIGTTISLALANAGLISFHKLGETNPREIELIANRHPPFGNQVKEAVSSLPKYELAIEQVKKYKERTADLVITINLINKDILQSKPNTNHQAYFLIGDTDNNIVFKWRILDSVLLKDDGWRRKIDVKRNEMGPDLFVHLLSQEWGKLVS